MIEPIFFEPIYKKVVWGGNNIKSFFNRNIKDADNIGESWEVSAHKEGISKIKNDSFSNQNLQQLFSDKTLKEKIFGSKSIEMERFPILIKFIDAKDNLSIQVHPDDEYAKINENDSGKNEVWYILDCKKDAKIVYGFKNEIDKNNIKNAINDIEKNVKYVNVKKGDFISIPAGTIHTICGGITLCEVQQSSDVTYRVYDWNRLGLDGKPRQLHTKKALDVIKIDNNEPIKNYLNCRETKNIYCTDKFNIDLVNIEKEISLNSNKDSFVIYIVLDGNGNIECGNFEESIERGSSFLIPAHLGNYKLHGNLKLLKVYI